MEAVVVRAYKDGSSLKIVTDEEARCYYNFNTCNFNLANGTSMTTAFSKIHNAGWNVGKTYNIKCEDVWGNRPSECSIKIIPSMIN